MYYNCRHSSSVLVTNQHNMYSGNSEFHSVWCTEKVKLNATFVGAMWPPRFAEASLGREPATSQVEDLWVSVLPQPAVVQFVPDILDSVCFVDTKSTSTNM